METRDPVVLPEMTLGYIPLLAGSNQVKAKMVVSRVYGMRWRGSGILKLALHMVGEAGNTVVGDSKLNQRAFELLFFPR